MSNVSSGHSLFWCILFVWNLHTIGVMATTPTLTFSLLEESPASSFVGNLSSSIKSNISNVGNNTRCDVSVSSLRYSLLPGQWSTSFNLDSKSGILRSNKILNRESICLPHAVECVVEIQAAIVQPIECFQVFQIDVVIVDINDNSPTFPTNEMSISVTSGSKPETTSPFRLPSADDLDSEIFGVQRYGLIPNSSYFTVQWISSEDGVGQLFLILTKELPKVNNPDPFQLTVEAYDGGIPPRTGQLLIDVLIQTTQHGPIFDLQMYNVTVPSDISPWTVVTTVKASTSDPLGKIVYSIGDQTVHAYVGLFAVGNTSGAIYTTRPIHVPTVDTYTIQIQAEDDNTPPNFDYTTVVITIKSFDDLPPTISITTMASSGVAEVNADAPIGTFIAFVAATSGIGAKSPTKTIKCSLINETKPGFLFQLKLLTSGSWALITATTNIAKKHQRYHVLTISCGFDVKPEVTNAVDLPLTVLGPMFDRDVCTASVLQFSEIGTHVITIEADTADNNKTGNVTYALFDETGSLSIDQTSGEVTTSSNIEYRGLNESTIQVSISATEIMDSQTQITTTAILRIKIINSNYYSPAFVGTTYSFTVPCNAAIGSIIGRVGAYDRDYPPYNDFRYYVETDSDGIKLNINSTTGVLTLAESLLLKTGTTYHVTVGARDVFPPFHYATSFVSVVVENASLDSPLIEFPSELNDTVEISPSSRPGLAITRIIVRDGTSGSNAILEYDILTQPDSYNDFTCTSRNVDDLFIVNSLDGVIILNRTLANYSYGSCFVIAVSVSNAKFVSTGILKIKLTSNDSIESFESIQKQQEHTFNQQLIIAVVVATVVVVIILIIAIVVVIRKVRPTAHRCQDETSYTSNCQLSSLSSKCGAKTGKLFEVGSLEDNLWQRIECSRSREVSRLGDEITDYPDGRGGEIFAIDKKMTNRRDSDVTSGCSSGGSSQADSGRGPSDGFDDQFTIHTPHSLPPSVYEEHFQAWQRSARSNHNHPISINNATKATPAMFRPADNSTFDSKSRIQLKDVNSRRQVSMVALRDFNEKSRRMSLESDLNSECESSTSGSFTFDCNTFRSIHI